MPLRILLINVNRCVAPYVVYPLGLAHVAAALVRAGHAVEMADCALDPGDIDRKIRSFGPELVGLSLRNIDDVQIQNTAVFSNDLAVVAARVRGLTKAPIVAGGSGYALFPERLLAASGADFGIAGEADEAFPLLADALQHESDVAGIAGLVFRHSGTIVRNPAQPCATASIVVPLLPPGFVEFYIRESSMLNLQTQRGCAYQCCYCTYPLIEGTAVRPKDPLEIGDELAQVAASGARYFFVVDSVFNSSGAHVSRVCEEILRRNLGLKWGCFLRPQGITPDLMEIMARAGLSHIEFGTDSFSDSVLQEYGKNFTFEDVCNASEFARQADVHYAHFLIVGGPGETEATMRESFENSKRLKKTVHFPFAGMRVYPQTALYERAISEGVITGKTDLLPPFFYISPSLTKNKIFSLLKSFSQESGNWVIGELPEENAKVAKNLRAMGVVGPLWEFLVR